MNITFTATNIPMTDAMKAYAEKKAERIKKHSEDIMHLHFTFSKTRDDCIVSAQFKIPKVNQTHAKETSQDMYKTIDLLVDKILHIIEKEKNR
jgi:putative sigma-54 modulation protein